MLCKIHSHTANLFSTVSENAAGTLHIKAAGLGYSIHWASNFHVPSNAVQSQEKFVRGSDTCMSLQITGTHRWSVSSARSMQTFSGKTKNKKR